MYINIIKRQPSEPPPRSLNSYHIPTNILAPEIVIRKNMFSKKLHIMLYFISALMFLVGASHYSLESKDGVKILAKDIHFKENNTISFKRFDNQKTYSITSDILNPDSLEDLKASLRPSIRYKLEVSSLGTKRNSEKTWVTSYGSKSTNINVKRSFQILVSTHSHLSAEVNLKVYSIQGKEEKAAYLMKSTRQFVNRLRPLVEEISDSASLEFTRYAATGYDIAKGNDEIDFYIIVSNTDSGQIEEWTSSNYVLERIKSGKIELLEKQEALDVADEVEYKYHKSDKSY